MYNATKVVEALRGLIGFRPHDDEEIEPLAQALTKSRSGLWLDSAHALITARNLMGAAVAITPDENRDQITNGLISSPLSRFLSRVFDDAAVSVLIALRTRKLLRTEAKLLLPLTQLYEGEGNIGDLIQPSGRFVALRLHTGDVETALNVRSIGLQFTAPVPNLPIHVLGSNSYYPDQSETVSYTGSGRMLYSDVDLVLSNSDSYLVGYYEEDLPPGVSAVRRNKAIAEASCAGCHPVNNALQKRWSQFVIGVEAGRIDNPGDPFDVIENMNYGINLAFSVGCDLTGLLINQQLNLAEAIRQQAAVIVLNEIAYSPMITTIEQQVRQNAMFALKETETPKLEKMLDALDIDLSGLNSRCLPEIANNSMVRRGTVFNR